jgi:hypothetical protein
MKGLDMTLFSQVYEVNMFFRPMNFLIGVLIFLLVLTTLGFSGKVFAQQCDVDFYEQNPDQNSDYYSPQYRETQDEESDSINSKSGTFTEDQAYDYDQNDDEFDRPQSNEFDYNNTY